MNAEASCGLTTVTVLTAEGRSAVAVIAVAGSQAEKVVGQYFQAANGQGLSQQVLGRIVYGHWGKGASEELVVCRRDVGEVEVHCHGGAASVAQIVGHLIAVGCERTSWRRWLADRSVDRFSCEAHLALAEASTLRTAKILLDQYHGALRCEVATIRELLSRGEGQLAQAKICRLLRFSELGLHLTSAWRVVIAGLPNVGKSSLVNAIVGFQRAIVFDRPGTTRDVVSATTAIEGWPIRLSDTAGLHQTTDDLEMAGIAIARGQLAEADLVIWVVDAQAIASQRSVSLEAIVDQQIEAAGVEIRRDSLLVVVNKIDLTSEWGSAGESAIGISALVGTGLEMLLKKIVSSLIPQLPAAGAAIPFTERQVLLLEECLECCRQ